MPVQFVGVFDITAYISKPVIFYMAVFPNGSLFSETKSLIETFCKNQVSKVSKKSLKSLGDF